MKRFLHTVSMAALSAFMVQGLTSTAAYAENDEIDFLSAGFSQTEKLSADVSSTLASDDELDNIRGMSGLNFSAETLSVAVLTGVATGNTVNGGVTGNNSLTDNALSNTQGVSFVVQNTGNNAVINAAMVVNLSMNQ